MGLWKQKWGGGRCDMISVQKRQKKTQRLQFAFLNEWMRVQFSHFNTPCITTLVINPVLMLPKCGLPVLMWPH